MKPKKFDELLRSKFDDSEFAYDPAQWEKVAERLDDRPGKRKSVLWLSLTAFATIGSVAASLAMVFSVASFLQHKDNKDVAIVPKQHVQQSNYDTKPVQALVYDVPHSMPVAAEPVQKENNVPVAAVTQHNEAPVVAEVAIVPQAAMPQAAEEHKKPKASANPYYTFNTYDVPEKEKTQRQTVISVAGGVNYGSLLSGYTISASGKKMIGDRLYVEGDVAIVNNSTIERNDYTTHPGSFAKVSGITGSNHEPSTTPGITGTATQQTNYNLYYAQVSPSVGYNVHKNFSVGVGADVQKLVQDSKTVANASADAGDVREAAPYDFGFVAKTECGLTKKIKAGIYYRQGLNNTIMPGANYIDRSYLQIQIKYAIFNKN